MAKIRIHEFAKQIDKNAGDIVKALQDNGYAVKSHMSSISDEEIAFVQKKFGLGSDNKKDEAKAEVKETKAEIKTEAKVEVAEAKEEKKAETNAGKKDEAEAPKKKKFVVVNHRPDAPKKKRPEGERPKKKRPEGDRVVKSVKKEDGEKDTVKTNSDVKVNKQENTPKTEDKVASAQTADNTVKNTETNSAGNKPQPSKAPSSENRERNNDNRDRNNDNRDRNNDNRDRNGNRDNRDRNGNRDNRDNRDRNGNRDNRDRNGNRDNRDRNGNRDNRDRNGNRDNRDNRDRNGGRGFRKEDNVPAADVSTDKNRKGRQDKLKYDKEKRRDDNDNELKKGKKGRNKNQPKVPVLERPVKKKEEPKEEVIKTITIPETLTIGELADKMKIQASALIKKLFLSGQIVTLNTEIDFETAENIAIEYEIIAEKEEVVDVIEELLKEEDDAEETLVKRPPVVCVMGHVDHGKTSLLDAIRETNVISGEAGGITQHIGAYVVTINGEKITFLDTPGHEAFTAMRMRGAQSTDIAILVVAADDGVMPQTVEAINHAKAAGIEIIVAINKIDKPSANIERVKKELTEYELIPEDWGGSTICVPVSAHSREGIDNLLEMVLLQAEVLELKANPNRMARGLIIEAKLDKGRGSVANILIQKGTLHVGDCIAVGSNYGKVRAMTDERGKKLKEAGPSTPVEILGLNGVPNAGDTFVVTKNEKEARNFAETFIRDSKIKMLEGTKKGLSLDDLFTQIQAGDVKEFNIVVKADVQGSVEAVKQSLTKLSNDEVVVKIIHGGVGAINESDVILASASNAIIIGFNTRPDNQAKEIADNESVDIRLYNVIYKAIEDVEAAMKGLLDPVFEEKVIGHAEIRQTFKASGVGTIAGSYVLDGIFERGCSARITRDGEQIFDGPLASLKRFQDDVKEVKAGFECGLVFEKFNDLKEGDLIESYKMVEVPR